MKNNIKRYRRALGLTQRALKEKGEGYALSFENICGWVRDHISNIIE